MAALASYGYKVERMLGEGSFGAVFMCSKAGSQVAIKHIKKRFHSRYTPARAFFLNFEPLYLPVKSVRGRVTHGPVRARERRTREGNMKKVSLPRWRPNVN